MSVWKDHRRSGTRLINAYDYVAVGDQLLILKGSELAIACETFEINEYG